jgi:hypothetical protein
MADGEGNQTQSRERDWEEAERAKYALRRGPAAGEEEPPALPRAYGEDRLALLVRDPLCIFAYWEVTPAALAALRERAGAAAEAAMTLRVYKVAGDTFDGTNASRFFDIDVTGATDNWYVTVDEAGRAYCAEIGVRDAEDRFHALARANSVTTPPSSVAGQVDPTWQGSPEEAAAIYARSARTEEASSPGSAEAG